MKIVFDTNVILSALITQGLSSRVLDICIDKHSLYISSFIIEEVMGKLRDKFKAGTANTRKTKTFLLSVFELIKLKGDLPEVCRDPDDNNILQLSKEVRADVIITGDRDLLELKLYEGTLIINPREFIERFHASH